MARDIISVRPQLRNASCSMLVTELGMVIELRFEQLLNASCPILVTVFGMIVFLHPRISLFEAVSIRALQLLRLSNKVLLASTTMAVISKQV